MAKADRPLQVFRGTTLDAVNHILKTNADRLEALSPAAAAYKTTYPATDSRFGAGHYFSNDPVTAYYYAHGGADPETHNAGVVLHGHLEDKNPLLIPNAGFSPNNRSMAHPDPELRDRALEAWKNLRPHLEERLATRHADLLEKASDPEGRRNANRSDWNATQRFFNRRQQDLEAGHPTEIARMGKQMGYSSALIYQGDPEPEETDEPRVRTAAHVLAYNPSAVKLSGAVPLKTVNNATDLLKHFSTGHEAGRA